MIDCCVLLYVCYGHRTAQQLSWVSFFVGRYCSSCSRGSKMWRSCPTGSYCVTGSGLPVLCPAGRFGSATLLTAATCNGACTAGYFCVAGSTSATATICPLGSYCPASSSVATACAAGLYGSTTALATSSCTGPCTAGYWCPLGASSATANACAAGYYCPPAAGAAIACPLGTYASVTRSTTAACGGQCSAGRYGCCLRARRECAQPPTPTSAQRRARALVCL